MNEKWVFSTFDWDNFNWTGARFSSGMGTPEFGHFDFGIIDLGQRFAEFLTHWKIPKSDWASTEYCGGRYSSNCSFLQCKNGFQLFGFSKYICKQKLKIYIENIFEFLIICDAWHSQHVGQFWVKMRKVLSADPSKMWDIPTAPNHVLGFCLLLPKDLAEISENVWKAVRKTTISSTYERLDKKTMVSVQIF